MPRMVGNASTDIAAPRAAIASPRSLSIGMSLLTKSASDDLAAQPLVHGDRAEVTEVYSPPSSPRSHFAPVVPDDLLNQTPGSTAAGAYGTIARDVDAAVKLAVAIPRHHDDGSWSAAARLRRRGGRAAPLDNAVT